MRSARLAALSRFFRSCGRAHRTLGLFRRFLCAFAADRQQHLALTGDGLRFLERVWRREEKIEGLTFAETDEIDMALNLAVREVSGWQQILTTQRDRTQNPDRKARFEFVMPALSADPVAREQAFARFRDVKNRSHEPWVLESLRYLNHPLRETSARSSRQIA